MKIHSSRLELILVGGICTGALCLGASAQTPKAGDKAPLIEGKDQDGKTWKLADEVGKKIVLLYFYPKDQTTGCTIEAHNFQRDMAKYDAAKAVVRRNTEEVQGRGNFEVFEELFADVVRT